VADRGIIFSAPMVRALLDGRKTQTRRLLNPQPVQHVPDMAFTWGKFTGLWPDDWFGRGNAIDEALPYAPGDRLYVREAFSYADHLAETVWYWADGNIAAFDCGKPKPSIHLPRWASRLTLLVTDVRVQRVAEISEADARAEGIAEWWPEFEGGVPGFTATDGDGDEIFNNAKSAFADLWNSLHTKPGERWEDNPWVCAVSFTVRHGNIDRSDR
jgi:hypothetical protein